MRIPECSTRYGKCMGARSAVPCRNSALSTVRPFGARERKSAASKPSNSSWLFWISALSNNASASRKSCSPRCPASTAEVFGADCARPERDNHKDKSPMIRIRIPCILRGLHMERLACANLAPILLEPSVGKWEVFSSPSHRPSPFIPITSVIFAGHASVGDSFGGKT